MEGPPRTETGLGLLPVITTMAGAKTTTQVQARVPGGAGLVIEAYEIHMGETRPRGEGQPAFEIISRNGRPVQVGDGWVSPDRRIWGTYLHGLFDRDEFRRQFSGRGSIRPAARWDPTPRPCPSGTFRRPNWTAWPTCCGSISTWPGFGP